MPPRDATGSTRRTLVNHATSSAAREIKGTQGEGVLEGVDNVISFPRCVVLRSTCTARHHLPVLSGSWSDEEGEGGLGGRGSRGRERKQARWVYQVVRGGEGDDGRTLTAFSLSGDSNTTSSRVPQRSLIEGSLTVLCGGGIAGT